MSNPSNLNRKDEPSREDLAPDPEWLAVSFAPSEDESDDEEMEEVEEEEEEDIDEDMPEDESEEDDNEEPEEILVDDTDTVDTDDEFANWCILEDDSDDSDDSENDDDDDVLNEFLVFKDKK